MTPSYCLVTTCRLSLSVGPSSPPDTEKSCSTRAYFWIFWAFETADLLASAIPSVMALSNAFRHVSFAYKKQIGKSLINNWMVRVIMRMGTSRVGSKVWDWWVGSIQDPWYVALRTGWPLEARRSLFPDSLWLCVESSPHRRALHIPVQILAGEFKLEFLPTVILN